jgi:hypothetical protein
VADAVVDVALERLAAYFATLTGIVEGKRGWPEHPEDLDLSAGPVVTVTYVDERRQLIAPWPLDTGPQVTWKVADLVIEAQLDLWAAYRAQRDASAEVLEAGLHNRIPWQHGLWLELADYHGRPVTVTASAGRNVEDDAAAEVGEWRRRWTLSVVTDLVVVATTPEQLETIIRTTSGDVTEPDKSIT